MGSLSIWHWMIVLLIVVLIFGTKKLRNIGSDVGGAVKNFKDAMNEGTQNEASSLPNIFQESPPAVLIEAEPSPILEVKTATKRKTPVKKTVPKPIDTVTEPVAKKPSTRKVAAKPRVIAVNKEK